MASCAKRDTGRRARNRDRGIRNWELGIGNGMEECATVGEEFFKWRTSRRICQGHGACFIGAVSAGSASLPHTSGENIRERAFEFSCSVVRLGQSLFAVGGVSRLLAPQLIACATSTSAMLEEARAAESKRDFISKCAIALKECRESHVRLRVLETCGIGPTDEVSRLRRESHEILSILSAIVRNAKQNSHHS